MTVRVWDYLPEYADEREDRGAPQGDPASRTHDLPRHGATLTVTPTWGPWVTTSHRNVSLPLPLS